ncbi:MAG: TonB-dependent receptor [Acidobacteriota bacterium]|nr:TonB-dependent receptor [Acidobacteriota bacterium]
MTILTTHAAARFVLAYTLTAVFILFTVPKVFAQEVTAPGGATGRLARVEGVVVDQTGAPVVGAQVSQDGDGVPLAVSIADDDGRFSIDTNAASGTVTVRARGFAPFTRRWNRVEFNSEPLRIVLAPAAVAEDVTVTATRTETRLSDTAASVRVLSAANLESTAALTVDDALRQVPGFSLFRRAGSRTANPTAQGVSLRGVGASGASRAVVLADGVPLNDPFGGWVYWGRVPRESVSRVEVLRGGSSSLYGSAALGGVVQLLTRPTGDDDDSDALSLELSYGNQRTPDGSLFAGTRRGKWGASLAAESFRTDGYILVDERERGRADTPAGSRRAGLVLTLERFINQGQRLFVRGSLFGESRANGTPLQTNRTHIRQLIAGGDWQTPRAGAFTLRAYGGTQVFDQNFSAVAANRDTETLTRVQRVPAQFIGFTAQWSRAVGTRNALVAGLDAREVRGASDEIVYIGGRAASLVGAGGRERSIGVFAQDTVRLTPQLFVTAGARFDRWRNYDAQQATRARASGSTTTTLDFRDRIETAFSPQLSVLYKPAESVSLFASVNRAFRAPTLNELYRSFRVGDALTLANENLRAERLTGGEAGAGFAAFERRLDVRTTFFWSELTRPVANVTLLTTPALITRQRQNLGRTRARGLELEAEAHLTSNFTLSGGYSLTDATVLRFPANTSLEGLLIPQVPRHYVSFQARYVNPSLLTVGVQGRATSSQFDDDQNRFRLGRYFTLDALASRRVTRRVDLFIAAENLFNQRYDIGRTPVRTLGPPLLARVGFRLRLGAR